MTLKYAIDKINYLNNEIEKSRKIREKIIAVLYNPNDTTKDSIPVDISLSKEEAKDLCHILLDHISYTDKRINEIYKIDIPDV